MVESHRDGSGLIYIIQALDESPVKIGFTRERGPRLSQLQVGSPYPLRVLTEAPGTMIEERAIHAALAHERLSGEWFAWLPRTINFISHLRSHRNIAAAMETLGGQAAIPAEWDAMVVAENRIPDVFGLRGAYRWAIIMARRKNDGAPACIELQSAGRQCSRFYKLGDVKRWLLDKNIPHVVGGDAGRFTRPLGDVESRARSRSAVRKVG